MANFDAKNYENRYISIQRNSLLHGLQTKIKPFYTLIEILNDYSAVFKYMLAIIADAKTSLFAKL
jgi:hypothetical protein